MPCSVCSSPVVVRALGRTRLSPAAAPPGALVVLRAAMFDGDQTWVVDAEDRLRKRTLRVISGDSVNVLVTEGLSPGDRVLLTPLSLPVEGMVVAPTAKGG